MSSLTFIDLVLAGEIKDPKKEINEYISRWHMLSGDTLELHDWLGMTWEEYSFFVEYPQFLPIIILRQQLNRSKI